MQPQAVPGQNPGYRIYEAQAGVHQYSSYIKWISWILIIIGGLKAFGAVIGGFAAGIEGSIVIDGPDGTETYDLPTASIIFEKALECLTGVLLMVQGKLGLMAADAKTRTSSWDLVKRALWIVTAHVLLYALQAITTLGIIGEILDDWDESSKPSGSYTVSRDDDFEFTFDRTHNGPHSLYSESDVEDGLVFLLVIAILFSMFIVMVCLFLSCCGCIVFTYYKFHLNCKELEQVTQQSFQQQQVPVQGVVRGEVVGYNPEGV